jgi:hypothetical protein
VVVALARFRYYVIGTAVYLLLQQAPRSGNVWDLIVLGTALLARQGRRVTAGHG